MTNAVLRILWFVFVGWWLGLVWFLLCLFLMATIVFLPVGAWAVTKTWKIMTLQRSPRKVVVKTEEKMKEKS